MGNGILGAGLTGVSWILGSSCDGWRFDEVAIRFEDLTLGYDRHPAVHHLDGEVESGALLAICGPNGAGKSTLLKGIAGTLAPLEGSIALPA